MRKPRTHRPIWDRQYGVTPSGIRFFCREERNIPLSRLSGGLGLNAPGKLVARRGDQVQRRPCILIVRDNIQCPVGRVDVLERVVAAGMSEER